MRPAVAKGSRLRGAGAPEAWVSRLRCHNFHRTEHLWQERRRRKGRIEVTRSLLSPGLLRVLFFPFLEERALAKGPHERSSHGGLDALAVLPPAEEPDQVRVLVRLEDQVHSARLTNGSSSARERLWNARTASGAITLGRGFAARHGVARIRALAVLLQQVTPVDCAPCTPSQLYTPYTDRTHCDRVEDARTVAAGEDVAVERGRPRVPRYFPDT